MGNSRFTSLWDSLANKERQTRDLVFITSVGKGSLLQEKSPEEMTPLSGFSTAFNRKDSLNESAGQNHNESQVSLT
jgi:hypothetical protein